MTKSSARRQAFAIATRRSQIGRCTRGPLIGSRRSGSLLAGHSFLSFLCLCVSPLRCDAKAHYRCGQVCVACRRGRERESQRVRRLRLAACDGKQLWAREGKQQRIGYFVIATAGCGYTSLHPLHHFQTSTLSDEICVFHIRRLLTGRNRQSVSRPASADYVLA